MQTPDCGIATNCYKMQNVYNAHSGLTCPMTMFDLMISKMWKILFCWFYESDTIFNVVLLSGCWCWCCCCRYCGELCEMHALNVCRSISQEFGRMSGILPIISIMWQWLCVCVSVYAMAVSWALHIDKVDHILKLCSGIWPFQTLNHSRQQVDVKINCDRFILVSRASYVNTNSVCLYQLIFSIQYHWCAV